jgi:membrane-bound ClpP family serine protease
VKLNKVKSTAAAVGASALIAMATSTAALGPTSTSVGAANPEHFGGPVNTTIIDPPADIGVPTASPSNAPLATADTIAPTT